MLHPARRSAPTVLANILLTSGLLCLPGAAFAADAPKFAAIFSDHAVLQRDKPVHVWGTSAPGAALTVTLKGVKTTTTAAADGHWQADLPAQPAGGPYALTLSDGAATTTLNDILVGDVFLCSGQSNMEFQVKYATSATIEINGATNSTRLRYVNIDHNSSVTPLGDLATPAAWQVISPQTVGDASAVCYYMSKAIAKAQNVPVGMIDSYWGGTIIEAWISEPSLRRISTYDPRLDALAAYVRSPTEATAAWEQARRDSWKASEADIDTKLKWIDPAYRDSEWRIMTPDGPWETSGDQDLATFDGIVWYRTSITLTKAQAKQAAHVTLGPVDDADITWVNGVQVGATYSWDAPRNYAIPAGTLKVGKNVIVVRATDTGGGGGLWGKPTDRRLTFEDGTTLDLPEKWKYKISGPILPGANVDAAPWSSPNGLTNLYNGMIAPLAPYTLRGVAWYQGEANTNAAVAYQGLLANMMQDWRTRFNNPDLPFLIVQLAAYGPVATKPVDSTWAALRDSQRKVVAADPHAGLTVAVDFGDRTDIHPPQKTVIGNRLARNAQAVIYGNPVSPGGPVAISVERSSDDLIVNFKDTNGGLVTYSSASAIGFEVCGSDGACRFAPAVPDGNRIILVGGAIGAAKVRYAWADSPIVNLYSKDDLPAVPFEMELTQ